MNLDIRTMTDQATVVLRHLANPPWLYVALGTLGLLLFLWLLVRRQPRAIVAFADKAGRVRVSLQAIADMAKASCEQVEAVQKVKVRVRAVRNRPVIELRLRLDNTGNIRIIRNGLKRHIGLILEDNLGFEKGGDIHIEIEGIKGGPLSVPGQPQLALTGEEQEAEALRDPPDDPILPEAEDERRDSPAAPVVEDEDAQDPAPEPEKKTAESEDEEKDDDDKGPDKTPDPMARPGSWFARRKPQDPESDEASGEERK
ncbi:MAG: hypothetical protein ACFE0O_14850 [Opitutales bacterium]